MLAKYVLATTIFCLCATAGHATDPFPAGTDFVRRAGQAGSQQIADARGALAISTDPAVRQLARRPEDDGVAANGADTALQEFARDRVPILRQRLAALRSLRTS